MKKKPYQYTYIHQLRTIFDIFKRATLRNVKCTECNHTDRKPVFKENNTDIGFFCGECKSLVIFQLPKKESRTKLHQLEGIHLKQRLGYTL